MLVNIPYMDHLGLEYCFDPGHNFTLASLLWMLQTGGVRFIEVKHVKWVPRRQRQTISHKSMNDEYWTRP